MDINNLRYKIILLSFTIFLVGCKKELNKQSNHELGENPNIIFFIADDMYPSMFNNLSGIIPKGEVPNNLTPALDRLAREGVWLDNMKVVSPVCTPSRFNCLTGNFASRSVCNSFQNNTNINEGQPIIQWNSFIVPGEQETMGTYFQRLGYKTGFVGKNHIVESVAQIGKNTRPDLNANPKDPKVKEGLEYRHQELQKDIMRCGFDYADALYHNNPDWLGIKAIANHNMDWITEKGIEFIDIYKEEPFMLYFASTLPHEPNESNRSWETDRRITARGILDEAPKILPQYNGKLTKKEKREIAKDSGLESSIRNIKSIKKRIREGRLQGRRKKNLLWLDDALSALFKKLEDSEVLDNTIIVFFNDHGQELKGTLYEGGINSEAFIWKKGGFKVGSVLKTSVSNVDFLPTLLDFAGDTKNLNSFDGFSFKDALDGKEYQGRSSMYHELGYARAIVKNNFKYYAVRYPKWAMNLTFEERKEMLIEYNRIKKLNGRATVSVDPSAPFGHLVMIPGGELAEKPAYDSMPYFSDPDQLYDLKNDPKEMHNLIDDPRYANKIKELKNELRKYINKLPGQFDI